MKLTWAKQKKKDLPPDWSKVGRRSWREDDSFPVDDRRVATLDGHVQHFAVKVRIKEQAVGQIGQNDWRGRRIADVEGRGPAQGLHPIRPSACDKPLHLVGSGH